jgi:hypothetical protein
MQSDVGASSYSTRLRDLVSRMNRLDYKSMSSLFSSSNVKVLYKQEKRFFVKTACLESICIAFKADSFFANSNNLFFPVFCRSFTGYVDFISKTIFDSVLQLKDAKVHNQKETEQSFVTQFKCLDVRLVLLFLLALEKDQLGTNRRSTFHLDFFRTLVDGLTDSLTRKTLPTETREIRKIMTQLQEKSSQLYAAFQDLYCNESLSLYSNQCAGEWDEKNKVKEIKTNTQNKYNVLQELKCKVDTNRLSDGLMRRPVSAEEFEHTLSKSSESQQQSASPCFLSDALPYALIIGGLGAAFIPSILIAGIGLFCVALGLICLMMKGNTEIADSNEPSNSFGC